MSWIQNAEIFISCTRRTSITPVLLSGICCEPSQSMKPSPFLHQILCGRKEQANLSAWIVQIGKGYGLSLCRDLQIFSSVSVCGQGCMVTGRRLLHKERSFSSRTKPV